MEDPRWTHGRWSTGVNEHENLLERSCLGEEYFQDLKEKVKRRMLSKSCPNIPSEPDGPLLSPLSKWKSMDIRRDFKKESFEDVRRGMLRSRSCPNIPSALHDSDPHHDFNPLSKWRSMTNGLDSKKELFEDDDDGIRRSSAPEQPDHESDSARVRQTALRVWNDSGIRRSASSAQMDRDSNSPRVNKAKQEKVCTTEVKPVVKSCGSPSFFETNISTAIYKTMTAICATIVMAIYF
ncbi:hypothetical protein GBF38_008014 [Nibea albiflora]|uniref:Uncharacterized protein n=1 Tax=Nibea albiflora TaxID=240163 RepID=A0ACB7EPW3_NIBAL|nr:hypothetical protein GBF38_008014 [Nibea albiflora]